jgi:ring-1,2-phenylacetyl-CoA epoxidase subunit PaaE
MSTPHFHELFVKAITPLTADAVQITFAIPPGLRDTFEFKPGQFVTLRAQINGESVRRSYSICSTPAVLARSQEISVGIKRVQGGVFSTWATQHLHVGDTLDVMPPDGRFTSRLTAPALHRVAFAAGSGITPVLSIMAHTLAMDASSRFTLVYGNQRVGSIMFNEALQDLKDRYPQRVSLLHILSRQPTEVALLHGRLDEAKVAALLHTLLPPTHIDEAFVCGPEAMIESTEHALLSAGVPRERVHAERFASGIAIQKAVATNLVAAHAHISSLKSQKDFQHALQVVLDGKTHAMGMSAEDNVLDTALNEGLDLPYACKGGVCCTCRAKVLEGKVRMEKNFTLEQWEIDKGFVLTCQAHALTPKLVISYDER